MGGSFSWQALWSQCSALSGTNMLMDGTKIFRRSSNVGRYVVLDN